jgi:hypothetical protein
VSTAGLQIRRATPADRAAIVELCRVPLQWNSGPRDEQFFAWKHDENPVGSSPAWVAEDETDGMVGVRIFLRWEFVIGGERCLAVRAVDTATHPAWQGRGIFRRLTLGALPDLRDDGVDAVFNTPNDQSRPGYLKMGWSLVGRVPISVRPTTVASAVAVAGARVAAEQWSLPTRAGEPATELLGDEDAIGRLLDRPPSSRFSTRWTPEALRWRFGFDALAYRVMPVGDRLADGLVVFRVRRRGTATEGTICLVLGRPNDAGLDAAYRRIAQQSGADYLIRTGRPRRVTDRFVPMPRLGPALTWRPVVRHGTPRLAAFDLALADIELF